MIEDPPSSTDLALASCDALHALLPKERAFALAYARTGQATASAIAAGFSGHSAYSQACRLLKRRKVVDALQAVAVITSRPSILTITQLREHWSRVVNGEHVARNAKGQLGPASIAMRLRASELLGRSLGAFLDRIEHSGKVEGAMVIYLPDNGRAPEAVIEHEPEDDGRLRAGQRRATPLRCAT